MFKKKNLTLSFKFAGAPVKALSAVLLQEKSTMLPNAIVKIRVDNFFIL